MYSNSLELCFGILESEIAFSFHLQFQISFNALLTAPSLSVCVGRRCHRGALFLLLLVENRCQGPPNLSNSKKMSLNREAFLFNGDHHMSPYPDFLILVPAYPSGLVLWPLVSALLIKIPQIPYLFLDYAASKIWPTHPTGYRLNISVLSPN